MRGNESCLEPIIRLLLANWLGMMYHVCEGEYSIEKHQRENGAWGKGAIARRL